jgi:hypothetical protein
VAYLLAVDMHIQIDWLLLVPEATKAHSEHAAPTDVRYNKVISKPFICTGRLGYGFSDKMKRINTSNTCSEISSPWNKEYLQLFPGIF